MTAPPIAERFIAEFEAHRKILYKVAAMYCANPADRQDLMQEIVVQLWRSFPNFDARSRFSTWMYRVALNVAISWVRTDHRRRAHTVDADSAVMDTALADAAAGDMPPELAALFAEFVSRLGELERALLLLYLEGSDHATIAAILGISSSNVATKIARLKQRLQSEIAP